MLPGRPRHGGERGAGRARALAGGLLVLSLGVAHAQTPPAPGTAPADSALGLQPRLESFKPSPNQPVDAQKAFALLDVDGDGQVTPAEWRERKMVVFYVLDRNGDLFLSATEIRLAPEVFAAADLDGDRRISAYEFDQAEFTRFDRADSNGDGVVTVEEFETYRSSLSGGTP